MRSKQILFWLIFPSIIPFISLGQNRLIEFSNSQGAIDFTVTSDHHKEVNGDGTIDMLTFYCCKNEKGFVVFEIWTINHITTNEVGSAMMAYYNGSGDSQGFCNPTQTMSLVSKDRLAMPNLDSKNERGVYRVIGTNSSARTTLFFKIDSDKYFNLVEFHVKAGNSGGLSFKMK